MCTSPLVQLHRHAHVSKKSNPLFGGHCCPAFQSSQANALRNALIVVETQTKTCSASCLLLLRLLTISLRLLLKCLRSNLPAAPPTMLLCSCASIAASQLLVTGA